MVYNRYTDKLPEKYKKYAFDFSHSSISELNWQTHRYTILNSMIGLRNFIIPYLKEHNLTTDSIKSGSNINSISSKNHDFFLYQYKGIDVLVHDDCYRYKFYVLYEPVKEEDLTTTTSRMFFDNNNSGLFGEEYIDFSKWYIANENDTSLSLEEFVDECRFTSRYRLSCFQFEKTSKIKFGDRNIFSDDYKNKISDLIQSGGDIDSIVNSIASINDELLVNYLLESDIAENMEDDVYMDGCDIMLRNMLDFIIESDSTNNYVTEPSTYSLGGYNLNIDVKSFIHPSGSYSFSLKEDWNNLILDLVSDMVAINNKC